MSRACDYTYTSMWRDSTNFFDPRTRKSSEYCCRLGFQFQPTQILISDEMTDGIKVFFRKIQEVLLGSAGNCSQRGSHFDVYMKVIPTPITGGPSQASSPVRQKIVGSVHGRLFKHLMHELHLERPLQLRLSITFNAPVNKTVVTKAMTFISDPRDKLWPKAFKFDMELDGKHWTIPLTGAVVYSINVDIIASPFSVIGTAKDLGIIPHNGDREAVLMNKSFLEDQAYSDFTLVSGNGKDLVKCHKLFLAKSSTFFQRMIETNMKEGAENKCRLDGSTKKGIEALLKFLYYRGVEDALNSSAIAYELVEIGHKYDIPHLEEAMKQLLLAKLDGWWDLDVVLNLFLRTRLLEDGDGWEVLKEKAKEVLKMRSNDLTSDSSTLLHELWEKNPNAAKELIRLISQQQDEFNWSWTSRD